MSRVAAWGCCVVGVLLVAVAAAQAAGPKKCKVSTAALEKQAAAAHAFTEKQLAAALARQNLKAVRLVSRQSGELEDGLSPGRGRATGKPVGSTFVEGGTTYIAGPVIRVPNGSIPIAHLEFAADAAGDVHQVVRAPRVKSSRSIVVCGCGPVGSGALPHDEQVYYELPAGTTYRGPVKVAYDAKILMLVPSRTEANGARCQAPPSMAPRGDGPELR